MTDLRKAARAAAIKHGIDPNLFERQINAESGFSTTARSPAGAQGIAQIMPATAKGWGVNPNDPIAALDAAAKNMGRYVKQFGSYGDALRAYNAGPGNVARSHGFAETNAYVKKIMGGKGVDRPRQPGSSPGTPDVTTTTTTPGAPGIDNRQARASLIDSFLHDRGGSVIDFAQQAKGLRDVAAIAPTSESTTVPGTPGSAGGAIPATDELTSRANTINAQALPYSWGGGHAGKTPIGKAIPLDCSGAVSKVLGIDPRVASAFKGWGSAGDGGNKGVTIYAKDTHVLMKINGHFFGTSASNPGGGAGWIKQSDISPQYLKGFTARHGSA